MSDLETVYLNKDNVIALILKDNDTAIDTSAVTRATLRLGHALIASTNGATDAILWGGATYATGEIHVDLGGSTLIEAGVYTAPLTIYSAGSTNGTVWGNIKIRVMVDPETT